MSRATLSQLAGASGTGTVRIGTGSRINAVDPYSIYAPGMIVQHWYLRTDSKNTYSAPVGSDNEVTELRMVITPRYATSRIYLQYALSYETSGMSDVMCRLSRNDSLVGTSTTDTGAWSGWVPAGYDADDASTPITRHLAYIDSPGTIGPLTYKFLIRATAATAYTMYLNRTVNSAGQDSYEVAISQILVQELTV